MQILINLQENPYKLIECLYNENNYNVVTKEFLGTSFVRIIEEKTLIQGNKLYDEYNIRLYDYIKKLATDFKFDGFVRAGDFLNQEHMDDVTFETIKFIEDEIGLLLKRNDEVRNLITTRYIDALKKTLYFDLSTDKSYINLDNKVRKTFKFFVENQFKIVKEMKSWFWDNWLFSEFYHDAIDFNLEKENRLEMMFDDGFDEYIKVNPSKKSWKEAYDSDKEFSDKYFKLDNKIKNAKTSQDKANVVDQILSIDFIEIDTYADRIYNHMKKPDDYVENEYQHITFNFEYFLDDEHGFKIILKNGTNFDILY